MREAFLEGRLGRARPSARAQWARLQVEALGHRVGRILARVPTLAYAAYSGGLLLATLPLLWGLVLFARSPESADRCARAWCRIILDLAGCSL